MTPAQTLRITADQLRKAGIFMAEMEARFLLGFVLKCTPSQLATQADKPLNPKAAELLDHFMHRRLAGEPLARLMGEWEFWGLPFELVAQTLVPRSDSETLIEAALEHLARSGKSQPFIDRQASKTSLKNMAPLKILDLGTGSGCLLISLLHELPNATGLGRDISHEAVACARRNAIKNGVQDRCQIEQADWTTGLTGPFDLIMSNPPYIETHVIKTLDIEVRVHDPVIALDGGVDGLVFYRALARDLPKLLSPEGLAILEIGSTQADSVSALMTTSVLELKEARKDLSSHTRALVFGRCST